MTWLVIACLAGAALVVAVPARRRRPGRRLARLPVPPGSPARTGRLAGRTSRGRPAGGPWSRLPVDRVRCVAGLSGLAVALLLGGWLGVLAAAVTAAGLDRGLRRLPPAALRARSQAEAAELPLAADLLAVALRGGAPIDRATAAVAEALSGPLGARLARVARVLRLGGAPAEAWAELSAAPARTGAAIGGAGSPVAGADRLVRAAVRSAEHGSALAGALSRLAADLRADQSIAADAAARRAGVLIVLPLGLCFLPAFILAGLVPVIVAILGDVL